MEDKILIIMFILFAIGMILQVRMANNKWKSNADSYIRTECGGDIYKVIHADFYDKITDDYIEYLKIREKKRKELNIGD